MGKSYVTIVPPERKDGKGPVLSNGTRVVLDDGTELKGVTRVILSAGVDSVWTAEIHCSPNMIAYPGMFASITRGEVSWWRRLLVRLAGMNLDVTSLSHTSREYSKP